MGPRIIRCSPRGYYAVTFNGGKSSLGHSFFLYADFHPSYDLIHFKQCLFLFFQSLTLLELAAHLESKAAKLRHEGLGKVKIALAGTNTSFF